MKILIWKSYINRQGLKKGQNNNFGLFLEANKKKTLSLKTCMWAQKSNAFTIVYSNGLDEGDLLPQLLLLMRLLSVFPLWRGWTFGKSVNIGSDEGILNSIQAF